MTLRSLLTRLRPHPKNRTLIAIPTIDRDAPLAARCFAPLRNLLGPHADLLILTRESDTQALATWPALYPDVLLETLPHYPIGGRHNYDALAEKRNRARLFALSRDYTSLFFVDADVEIRPDTFRLLQACLRDGADLAFAPYAVRWFGGQPIVGLRDATGSFSVERVPDTGGVVRNRPAIGGLGCALLGRRALEVPIHSRSLPVAGGGAPVIGEDIGFYLDCLDRHLRVDYLRHVVHHHLVAPGQNSR
jgi:hypothetical protein